MLRLHIVNVRCHESLAIEFRKGINVLYGPNGCGKTSIMEALTLLLPTKSIKGAKLADVMRHDSSFLEVQATIATTSAKIRYTDHKSYIFLNEKPSQKYQIMRHISILWLTQKIMLNFWQDPACRRAFIDRICINLFPSHGAELIKFEKIREHRRSIIEAGLEEGRQICEVMLLEHAYNITHNRLALLKLLNARLLKYGIVCVIDSNEYCKNEYQLDMSQLSFAGPHTAKISLYENGTDLAHGSTGEQNMALLRLLLEAIDLIPTELKVLLLDDIFSGIDYANQCKILSAVTEIDYVIISSQSMINSEGVQCIAVSQLNQSPSNDE